MINDMGIQVYDEAPDAGNVAYVGGRAPPPRPTIVDEEAAEAASIDASTPNSGRTNRSGAHVTCAKWARSNSSRAKARSKIAKAHRGGPQVHDHGDLRACPDGRSRRSSNSARQDRGATNSRSTTSSTGLMDFQPSRSRRSSITTISTEAEESGRTDSGAIAAENLERLKVAGLARFTVIRKLFRAAMLVILQKGTATRRRNISSCRRKFPRS